MIRYKFSSQTGNAFAAAVKQRVNAYFREQEVSKNANGKMVVKTIMALSMYLVPYFIILFAGISYIFPLFLLWILMGLGKAFVGTSVMHDALHGSYSRNKTVNKIMGFTAAAVGIDGRIWQIQHNVLHHTYTNIEHADEDIQPRFVMRFTPNQPRRWFHRYQYIYALFFYGISTLVWVTFKDFNKIFQYKKEGHVKSGTPFRKHMGAMVLRKLTYFFFTLVLPILVLPIPAWIVILMFVSMHLVAGIALSLIFQTAHVMPSSEFVEQEEPRIEENWSVHQLKTTTNFAMKNKLLSWFIGGLNYQVEHHLFPNVCHIHYPRISAIVQQTTAEFQLPYHAQKTFRSALGQHFRMLRDLGRN